MERNERHALVSAINEPWHPIRVNAAVLMLVNRDETKPDDAGRNLTSDNICARIVIMIRTQISLSKEEYQAAKAEAARLGISLAELLRRSVRQLLPADETRPWMRYAGMVESGEKNASQKIDEIVYGQKR